MAPYLIQRKTAADGTNSEDDGTNSEDDRRN